MTPEQQDEEATTTPPVVSSATWDTRAHNVCHGHCVCLTLYGASVAHSFLCQGYGRRLEFCNARPIGEANNVGMASDEEYDGGSKRDD